MIVYAGSPARRPQHPGVADGQGERAAPPQLPRPQRPRQDPRPHREHRSAIFIYITE